jgi:hypothetical protein
LVVGFLLGTAVAFPMPFLERHSTLAAGPVHYLGTLPPNVFMSSTQLMASTPAVVAVVTLALWFQRPTGARFTGVVLTGLLATLAKPGIAPAHLMTVAILSLLLVRSRRQEVRPAVARLLIAGLVIGFPLLGAYRGFMSGAGFLDLHAEVRPLVTWTAFTDQWYPDLIASWAFPLVVVGVLWSTRNVTAARLEWLLPAWSVTLISTLMFALLAEVNGAGQVVHAGNFAWGAMSATGGLYVISAIALHGISWRIRWIPTAVLALQAIAGLRYIDLYIGSRHYL